MAHTLCYVMYHPMPLARARLVRAIEREEEEENLPRSRFTATAKIDAAHAPTLSAMRSPYLLTPPSTTNSQTHQGRLL